MIIEEQSDQRVVIKAPAKLNLYLDVLARRDDGFHELESVMQTISLFDVITVERASKPGIQLAITGRACPGGPENLVVRAAESMLSAMNIRTGLSIILQKNTPLGAGLGGGSADAAATLVAVNRLIGDGRLGREALETAAAKLGSDVPFFLTGGTAIARGRGELIEPLVADEMQRFDYVVLYPGMEASTPRVFAALDLNLTSPRHNLRHFAETLRWPADDSTATHAAIHAAPANNAASRDRASDGSATDSNAAGNVLDYYNALEQPFRSVYPELAELQDRVRASSGRTFHVTGSGSAMFCAVRDVADGETLIEELAGNEMVDSFLCHGPVMA